MRLFQVFFYTDIPPFHPLQFFSQATQVIVAKNREPSSHLDNIPTPGCSPLQLLRQRKYIAYKETFDLLRPYMEYIVKVQQLIFERFPQYHYLGKPSFKKM